MTARWEGLSSTKQHGDRFTAGLAFTHAGRRCRRARRALPRTRRSRSRRRSDRRVARRVPFARRASAGSARSGDGLRGSRPPSRVRGRARTRRARTRDRGTAHAGATTRRRSRLRTRATRVPARSGPRIHRDVVAAGRSGRRSRRSRSTFAMCCGALGGRALSGGRVELARRPLERAERVGGTEHQPPARTRGPLERRRRRGRTSRCRNRSARCGRGSGGSAPRRAAETRPPRGCAARAPRGREGRAPPRRSRPNLAGTGIAGVPRRLAPSVRHRDRRPSRRARTKRCRGEDPNGRRGRCERLAGEHRAIRFFFFFFFFFFFSSLSYPIVSTGQSTEKFEPKLLRKIRVHPMMFCFLSHPLQARLLHL